MVFWLCSFGGVIGTEMCATVPAGHRCGQAVQVDGGSANQHSRQVRLRGNPQVRWKRHIQGVAVTVINDAVKKVACACYAAPGGARVLLVKWAGTSMVIGGTKVRTPIISV